MSEYDCLHKRVESWHCPVQGKIQYASHCLDCGLTWSDDGLLFMKVNGTEINNLLVEALRGAEEV